MGGVPPYQLQVILIVLVSLLCGCCFGFLWLGLLLLLFLSVSRVIQGGLGFAEILLPQPLGYYHISWLPVQFLYGIPE